MTAAIGTRVHTPDGDGKIVKIDLPESRAFRYVVELENNPFDWIKFPSYWPMEIEVVK